jgi:hypothetical protein
LPGLFLLSAALATADVDDAVTSAAANLTALSRLQPETDWLRADIFPTTIRPRVDRANGVIYGRVLAEKGRFKTSRGEFDDKSLDLIHGLTADHPNGLKARWTHPALSSDGLGKFLGRDRNIRRDGDRVLGDLHLDKTALQTPPFGGKPLGIYVMDLAESDPGAMGSSLVLKVEEEQRLAADGTAAKDENGKQLPPLWRPTKLHACDVVDDGDAVHNGFLSADLPDAVVRDVAAALDSQFSGCDRPTVEARGQAFLSRYLDLRFGDDDMSTDDAADPKPQPKPQPQPTNPPSNPPAPTKPNPPAPQPQPAGELESRLAAFEAKQAALEAEQERRLAAERAGTVDALFNGWEGRTDDTGRPDPAVTPDEAKRDAPGNLRALMLTADRPTFDALKAMVDRRPPGIFGRFFVQKMKQPGAGAEPPEVVAAKAWAKRKNEQMARS